MDGGNEAIRKAARGLEAGLLRQMLRAMEKAQLEDGLFGGGAEGKTRAAAFELMLSEMLAEREPLGLAEQIAEQLEREEGGAAALGSLRDPSPGWSDIFRWGAQETPESADEYGG
ncbi:MAG: hypothetical protein Q9Q40_08540 [Acidobacteriota bacterium]|nr:hypothetical protein [Acidobacteriota bacterium]